jgi:two-component SAPR family response regulator
MEHGSSKKRALSTSWHATALQTRNQIIESVGYEVTTTRESKLFLSLLEKEHFDVVVIGDSIDLEVRIELLNQAKRIKPGVPIVTFYKNFAEAQRLAAGDYLVEALGATEQFVAVLQTIYGGNLR